MENSSVDLITDTLILFLHRQLKSIKDENNLS